MKGKLVHHPTLITKIIAFISVYPSCSSMMEERDWTRPHHSVHSERQRKRHTIKKRKTPIRFRLFREVPRQMRDDETATAPSSEQMEWRTIGYKRCVYFLNDPLDATSTRTTGKEPAKSRIVTFASRKKEDNCQCQWDKFKVATDCIAICVSFLRRCTWLYVPSFDFLSS